MSIVTFGELLDRAAEFERRLERTYAALRDESRDGGVRLLTYYLSRHRAHLRQALDSLGPGQVERVRSIRLKYDVPFRPEVDFGLMSAPPGEVKARQLLEAAVSYDERLVSLYRGIIDQPLRDEARAFLEALVRLEEKDIIMLKKMIAMDYF
jgi:hypothetical protein